MQEFEFALDPSETLVIRRFLTPDRVPNKGKKLYQFALPQYKGFKG